MAEQGDSNHAIRERPERISRKLLLIAGGLLTAFFLLASLFSIVKTTDQLTSVFERQALELVQAYARAASLPLAQRDTRGLIKSLETAKELQDFQWLALSTPGGSQDLAIGAPDLSVESFRAVAPVVWRGAGDSEEVRLGEIELRLGQTSLHRKIRNAAQKELLVHTFSAPTAPPDSFRLTIQPLL